MTGPRLTLAGASGVVAVLAIGLAGLRSASRLWTSAAAAVTLGLLLGALLGVRLLKGKEQAACLGFALFGIVYLILVDWDWVGAQFGQDLTAGLGDLAESVVPAPNSSARANPLGTPMPTTSPEAMASHAVRVGNFLQISRMTLALLFGALGGTIASWLSRRDQRTPGESAD